MGECSKCGMVMKKKRGVKKPEFLFLVKLVMIVEMCSVTLFDDVIKRLMTKLRNTCAFRNRN